MTKCNKPCRVAVYCRVSTDKEDQKNSFESQKRYFSALTEKEPHLLLTEIFADEGISGTSTKKRRAFLRMMESARAGNFDLILTKEISRFARNTLDSIRYTRELKALGIGVIFLSDGIDTREGDAELRLAILSSIAQEESRKTSERVKWGQKRRMEAGVVFGRSMLGYDVKNGILTKNEKGAAIVKEIFRKYTEEEKGTHVIARELTEANVITPHVKAWTAAGIFRILKNEKYCGDLVQKKTYTPDYLTHEKKYNRGEEDFVICRDHHEPIVSREVFIRAQALLRERSRQSGKPKCSRHAFSGRIFCGICGSTFLVRRDSEGKTVFRCPNRACVMRFGLREDMALMLAKQAFLSLDIPRKEIERSLLFHLWGRGNAPKNDDGAMMRIVELYAAGEITHEEFLTARKKYERKNSDGTLDGARRCAVEREIQRLLSGEGGGDFFGRLGIGITVFSKERIEVSFTDLDVIFFFSLLGRGSSQTALLENKKTFFDHENENFS